MFKIFQKLLFTVILSGLNTIQVQASDRLLEGTPDEPDQRVIVIHEVYNIGVITPAQENMEHQHTYVRRDHAPRPIIQEPDICSIKCLLCGPEITGYEHCYPIYSGGSKLRRPWCNWWMTWLGAGGLITAGVMGLEGGPIPIFGFILGGSACAMGAFFLCLKLNVFQCISEVIDNCAK